MEACGLGSERRMFATVDGGVGACVPRKGGELYGACDSTEQEQAAFLK